MRVTEQRHQFCALLCIPQLHPVFGKPGPGQQTALAGPVHDPVFPVARKRGFAWQAACARGEPREKIVRIEPVRAQGGQGVATFNPGFGAQVFEIDENGWRCTHALKKTGRGFARKRSDDKRGGFNVGLFVGLWPAPDIDAGKRLGRSVRIEAWFDPGEGRQVVNPEPDLPMKLRSQLARQSPCDADVAKVVDDAAENVRAHDQWKCVGAVSASSGNSAWTISPAGFGKNGAPQSSQ